MLSKKTSVAMFSFSYKLKKVEYEMQRVALASLVVRVSVYQILLLFLLLPFLSSGKWANGGLLKT